MGVKNDILNKLLSDLLFITPANSYTNLIKYTHKGYRPLENTNQFNCAQVWFGPGDSESDNYNDNRPLSRVADYMIDIDAKVSAGTGEGNVDELIDTLEVDMFKWLFKSTGVTANKYCTFDQSVTGAVWRGFSLGNILYTRKDDTGIVRVQFPIKVLYEPQY